LVQLPEMRALAALVHEGRKNTVLMLTLTAIQGFGVEGMRAVFAEELDDPSCASLVTRAAFSETNGGPKPELALLNKGLNCFHLSLLTPCVVGSRITRLALHHNSVGDTGAVTIADQLVRDNSTPSLVELEIADDLVGDVGAIAIADAIRANKTLKLLHLGCNMIGDAGGLAFLPVFRDNTALQELILSYNRMTSVAVRELGEAHAEHRRTRPVIGCVFQGIRHFSTEMNPWYCSDVALHEKLSKAYRPETHSRRATGSANRYNQPLVRNVGM